VTVFLPPGGGGGDEVVRLARLELQSSRSGAETSKCNREVHEGFRLVADRHNFGSRTCNPTRVKLFSGDAVYHMLLSGVLGADDVELVVLPGEVPLVHVHDVVSVVNSEDGVAGVPVHLVCLGGHGGGDDAH